MKLLFNTLPATAIAMFGVSAIAQTTLLETDFDSLDAGDITAAAPTTALDGVPTGGSWAINPARSGFLIANDSGAKAFGFADTGTPGFVNYATLSLDSAADFSVEPVTVNFRTATRRTGINKGLQFQFRSDGVPVATLIWQQNLQWPTGDPQSNTILVGHNEEGASQGARVTFNHGLSSFSWHGGWISNHANVRDASFTFDGTDLNLSFGAETYSVNLTTFSFDTIVFSTTGSSTEAKGAWIDDVTITSGVAESPSDLKILSIVKSGTTVTVEFEGTDGQTYDLNKSTNLDFSTPDIRDTETLTGTTGTLTDDSATEDAAFYRVEQQP